MHVRRLRMTKHKQVVVGLKDKLHMRDKVHTARKELPVCFKFKLPPHAHTANSLAASIEQESA